MPQLINWKPDGLTWPAWVVSLELQPFAPFDCDADINIYHPKWSKTGVRVKTLLYREETLLSREKQTPLYWLKAPPPKLLCHEGGRLSFVNRCIASFHAYLREYCVFKAIILKKRNLSKKMSYKKNERRAELHWRMYCMFPHIIAFLQGHCFLFRHILSSRQIVTCKQHVPLTTTFLF